MHQVILDADPFQLVAQASDKRSRIDDVGLHIGTLRYRARILV